jgi:hypothetical protein
MHANPRHCGSNRRPRYTVGLTTLVDASVRIGATLLLLCVFGACAPKQKITLDCVPKEVTIYVDKEPLPGVPDSIKLRADQSHVLFFKGGGYESAMVVLESEEGEDGPALSPRDVCLELDLIERSRELRIEVEP